MLKLLHFFGLTNLTDEQVRNYYMQTNVKNSFFINIIILKLLHYLGLTNLTNRQIKEFFILKLITEKTNLKKTVYKNQDYQALKDFKIIMNKLNKYYYKHNLNPEYQKSIIQIESFIIKYEHILKKLNDEKYIDANILEKAIIELIEIQKKF